MKAFLLLLAGAPLVAATAAAAPMDGMAKSDEPPVKVSIAVTPSPAAPGGEAAVTVTLQPNSGIKLNKYPKIKLQVGASPGIVEATEGAIGASSPPPADQLESNYYKGSVDPLVVSLKVDGAATAGRHDLHGRLSYFYCVAASGYCAPAKVEVTIPLTVR